MPFFWYSIAEVYRSDAVGATLPQCGKVGWSVTGEILPLHSQWFTSSPKYEISVTVSELRFWQPCSENQAVLNGGYSAIPSMTLSKAPRA
jgi:hypothetical protein